MTQFHYDFYQRGPQPAMVMVHGFYKEMGILSDGSLISQKHLHAMPAASIPAHAPGALETPETGRSVVPASAPTTMTDAERAVIEAAEDARTKETELSAAIQSGIDAARLEHYEAQVSNAMKRIWRAVDALRKSREPVDPVTEAKASLNLLIRYAEWQMTEGASYHPTLPSAVDKARAAVAALGDKP